MKLKICYGLKETRGEGFSRRVSFLHALKMDSPNIGITKWEQLGEKNNS